MCFCQFCGYANCRDCFKKTRLFYDPAKDKSWQGKKFNNAELKRGKICTLCDRKFLIKKTMDSSF